MSREDLIRSLIDKSAPGLEIGASYNPAAPRRLGFQVHVLDHASGPDLRRKYALEPDVDCDKIEDVDFVWSGGSLAETVGAVGCYEWIVASHVIEHTPDIIAFLKDCAVLLTPTGRLVLATPDMRRCFDAFRPLASLGAAMQAHAERRTRHSPGTACDHVAYMANLDGNAGWTCGQTGRMSMANTLAFANAMFERALADPDYHDFHAWVFTPSSFQLLMSDLHALGQTDLREADFYPTDGFEFLSVLDKTSPVLAAPRDRLLAQIRRELMEFPEVTA